MAQRPRVGVQQTFQGAPVNPNAGAVAEQLSQVFSTFGNVAAGVAQREATEQGVLEGAEVEREKLLTTDPDTGQPAFEERVTAPELKAGLAKLTSYGQAFNESAIQSHAAAIDNDARLKLSALGEEFIDDPAGFANAASSYIASTLEAMPPQIQARMSEPLRQMTMVKGADVSATFKTRENERQLANIIPHLDNLTTDMTNEARTGDIKGGRDTFKSYEQQVRTAVENGLIGRVKGEQMILSASDNLTKDYLLGQFEDQLYSAEDPVAGIKAGEAFVDEFMQTTIEEITPGQRDALTNSMLGILNKRKAMLAQDARAGREAVERDQMFDFMDQVLAGTINADAKTEFDRDANELYYTERVLPIFDAADMTPDQRSSIETAYVKKVGFLPQEMAKSVRRDLRSGDPEATAFAADRIARLKEVLPVGVDITQGKVPLSNNDLAFAETINQLQAAGVPAEEAVDRAMKATDPNNMAQQQARQDAIKGASARESVRNEYPNWIADWVNDDFGGLFTSDPELLDGAASAMTADLSTTYENWFMQTGDAALAKKLSFEDMRRKWAPTEVDGNKRMMAYPPENFYQVRGEENSDWMRNQLYRFVADNSFGMTTTDVAELAGDGRLFLTWDNVTARQSGGENPQPSYTISVQWSEDQPFVTMQADNGTFRWRPDLATAQADADNQAAQAAREKQRVAEAGISLEWQRATGQIPTIGPKF